MKQDAGWLIIQMGYPRITLDASDEEAIYHCMSRCVDKADKLDLPAREMFRRMLWKVAEFCGVNVVTYAIMPNHFHILVHVPIKSPLSDDELLRRYRILHPRPNPFQTARLEVIASWLKNNTVDGIAWRNQQLALMNNVSAFIRLLKHRFTRWYNLTHDRVGTLWAERFKSVLVEYDRDTLRTVAAYIDLNAVRKGLVQDPKDYRFCGYAEALAGSERARAGLRLACPHSSWSKTQAHYRTLLYSSGTSPRENKASLNTSDFDAVMASDGDLSLAIRLRHRLHYLTAGSILGRHAFVAEQRARLARSRRHPRVPVSHRPEPVTTPISDLTTLHRIHRAHV